MTPRERAETISDFVPTTRLLLFYVEKLILAAIAEEREACAKIADADPYHTQSAEEIATLIRSRP
jgi:hypothetical protein